MQIIRFSIPRSLSQCCVYDYPHFGGRAAESFAGTCPHEGVCVAPDLATQLQVSESTIRRDLDYLEESGSAQRTHGGVFYTGPSPKLMHFDQRQESHWEKKRQIGEAAGKLIEDGDTMLLDGGSTTYELARVLVGRPLQVVTNSLPVANAVHVQRHARTWC